MISDSVMKRIQESNGGSIIIVDICEFFSFYLEFLKRKKYLRCTYIVDEFISEKFNDIKLTESQLNTLEKKIAFKTRDIINRSKKLGYINQVSYNRYKITEKINNLEPLILNLFNSRISSFTI